jgi:hypothetical protein
MGARIGRIGRRFAGLWQPIPVRAEFDRDHDELPLRRFSRNTNMHPDLFAMAANFGER